MTQQMYPQLIAKLMIPIVVYSLILILKQKNNYETY